MTTTRIGINGFGRMGRLALRAGWDVPGVQFVAVNDARLDAAAAAHLLTFDSVHGRWEREAGGRGGVLTIGDRELAYSQDPEPGQVDWRAAGADIVIEASGRFRTPETLQGHLDAGARRVIVAAPVKDPVALNVVVGVNDDLVADQPIITAASCTTNCLAPVVKVIHEQLGIAHGSITTLHDLTGTQTVVDGAHTDLRRARASSLSLIPTTTGSATAIGLIFPELLGRLDGIAVRVPLMNASLTDCVFEVQRPTTVEEVNAMLAQAAGAGALGGILGYEERPLVSVDFRGDPRSSIVDAPSTRVIDETQVKVLAWYDNEWGYANRLVDLARIAAARTPA